jgi:UDP-N-acetylglucosamine 3-dehydrogenase
MAKDMGKLNVAVIGLGNMGKNHARNYFEIEEATLVAVCDVNKTIGNALSEKFNCKYYEDYEEMFEKEKIDAVSIVVPTNMHEKVAIYAIERGKHVLVEKPIASTLDSAQKIIESAKQNKVKLMVGHIERFNPAIQKLKEMILKDKLGKITSIITKRVGVSPPQIKDANVIIDLGVHDIDIINYLIQKKVRSINAHAGKAIITDREDHAEIFILFEGDTSGFIQINWITPIKIRTLSITGTKGYAELDYMTQELKVFESVYEKTFDDFKDLILKFGTPNVVNLNIDKKEPLKEELKSFIDCILNDEKPATSGEEGLFALKIALKALEVTKNDT